MERQIDRCTVSGLLRLKNRTNEDELTEAEKFHEMKAATETPPKQVIRIEAARETPPIQGTSLDATTETPHTQVTLFWTSTETQTRTGNKSRGCYRDTSLNMYQV